MATFANVEVHTIITEEHNKRSSRQLNIISMASSCWIELTSNDVSDRAGGVLAVQPIGAVEQHGPHLPLGTDSIVAESVATEAIARFSGSALLLPTIAVALSREHLWAPGTISLSPQTLLSLLDDVGQSLQSAGVNRLVFLNGHGGNSAILRVICRELRIQYGLMTFLAHPQLPLDQGGVAQDDTEMGFAVHAGRVETSIMLYLRPELVVLDRAARHVPEWLGDFEHIGFGKEVTFGWSSQDFGATGVIGDPTLATTDQGKLAFESAVNRFVEVLSEASIFAFPPSALQ